MRSLVMRSLVMRSLVMRSLVMRRAVRVAVVGVGLVVTLVAGCGGGPSPQDWAGQVCQALTPWRTTIDDLNAQTATRMASATTSTQTRDSLVALLGGGESASETARAAVVAAGVPDVDGGDRVAERFVASLAGTRDAYARARRDLQAVSTADDATFYDGVAAVMSRLNDEYRASALDTTNLDSPELRQAFDGATSCR
jgi:hypothetical protein